MQIPLPAGSFDALIFDCDGTLVDSAALYLTSLQQTFAHFGLPFDKPWYMARTGLTPLDLLAAYGNEVQPLPVHPNDLTARITEAFQRNLHTLQEVAVVADIVRAWHGKVPMAVASNGQQPNVRGSLAAVGLLPYFNAVVTIDDVSLGKPAPDIYLAAAARLAVSPQRCLVLEDSDEGLTAARTAGMSTIDIRPYTHNAATESGQTP